MTHFNCPAADASAPDAHELQSDVELVLRPRSRDLGGFEVRRALPAGQRQMVGPFIFFDEMGPSEFSRGNGIDVRPHPHIGLATITYLFNGEILHRDSLGTEMVIKPGDVNWMKAGRGIVHSERTPQVTREADHHPLHGIQAWVALPLDQERAEPSFIHYPKAALPEIELESVSIRLIAGHFFGHTSPVSVDWPTLYAEIQLQADAEILVDDEYDERALYIVSGKLQIGDDRFEAGSMVILRAGMPVNLQSVNPTHMMLLGGKAIDGPRHIWWNFVASDQRLLEQAKADWTADRFDPVPNECERIALPESN